MGFNMGMVNTVPPVDDEQTVKTLKFPFQIGNKGLPAVEVPENYTYVNIVALMLTGTNERVMNVDLGVDVYQFVFESMTPIQKARLSNMVSSAIETFVPGTVVRSVVPSQVEYQDGLGSKITIDVTYSVGGETRQQQIEYTPTG